VKSLDACTTRLRLTVAAHGAVDGDALRRLGARGLVRPSAETLQVVVGTVADQLAGELREALRRAPPTSAPLPAPAPGLTVAEVPGPTAPAWPGDTQGLLRALGGRANVQSVESASTRLRIGVADAALIDRAALIASGARAAGAPAAGCVHVIVGPAAAAAASDLRRALGGAYGANVQADGRAGS